jgi:hypothetical protein
MLPAHEGLEPGHLSASLEIEQGLVDDPQLATLDGLAQLVSRETCVIAGSRTGPIGHRRSAASASLGVIHGAVSLVDQLIR